MNVAGQRQRSAAEWLTLAISLVIVGALIVVALVEESRRQEEDAVGLQVTFDTEHVTARGADFYVPYRVRNTGPVAISSAEIWIQVYEGERLAETVQVSVEFLPLQGTQDGVFITTYDPASHTLLGRLESLQFP
jgi:uncharacterized protein (TIGR02588 family)